MHFGAGNCANKTYRTIFKVKDANDNDVPNNVVNIARINSTFNSTKSGKSPYEVFLYNGTYKVNSRIDGVEVSKHFTVSSAKQEIVLKPDSADGKIEGKVVDSTNDNAIADAYIVISKGDVVVKTVKSASDGSFSVSLAEDNYNVSVTKSGYIPFSTYETVDNAQTTYMQTVKLVPGENKSGGLSGKIFDAVTGKPVEGVELKIRKGWNNSDGSDIVKILTTDSQGKYECKAKEIFGIVIGLESGNYTITATKDGYISSSFNVVVLPGVVDNGDQNATISPEGSEEQYRIVLTWGKNPRDLDSHVVGTTSNSSTFHVYYAHRNTYDNGELICNLDVDERQGGTSPETITLNTNNSEPYYYYVRRYAGEGTVATSGAKVQVYKGNVNIKNFSVPTNLGNGDFWNVFAIVNGKLIIRNTITSTSELSYASNNVSSYSISAFSIDEIALDEDEPKDDDSAELDVDDSSVDLAELDVDDNTVDLTELNVDDSTVDLAELDVDDSTVNTLTTDSDNTNEENEQSD
jgi:5-hydroxyisourate hydrolase-like protein (transthyretin family)